MAVVNPKWLSYRALVAQSYLIKMFNHTEAWFLGGVLTCTETSKLQLLYSEASRHLFIAVAELVLAVDSNFVLLFMPLIYIV